MRKARASLCGGKWHLITTSSSLSEMADGSSPVSFARGWLSGGEESCLGEAAAESVCVSGLEICESDSSPDSRERFISEVETL